MANQIRLAERFLVGSKSRILFPLHRFTTGASLFVEPSEYEDYRRLHGGRFAVQQLSRNDGGFGFLLNSMAAYARTMGYEYYWFLDDDITGFKFRNKSSTFATEIQRMESLARSNGYSQLMMSFQGHNWYTKEDIKERIGAWCCVLNKTDDILSVGADEELPIFNDWDLSARLIQSGKKTACYYGAMFVHKMKSHEGGAGAIYAKRTVVDMAIEILQRRYGSAVKTVVAHGQREPRFRWGKL